MLNLRLFFILGLCPLVSLVGAQTYLDLSVVGVRDSSFARATSTEQDTFFNIEGLRFRSVFDTSFGGYWAAGWAFSRSVDTTGDFTNLYGAAGGRRPCCEPKDQTFLVGQQGAYVLLPPSSSLVGLEFNNTAYTAAVLARGSGFSAPFGQTGAGATTDPDSLILTITGYLGGVPTFVRDVALADFRADDSAADYIVTEWTPVELTPGGQYVETDSVAFRLKSSDAGAFGNNTPDFFAIGRLQARLNLSALRTHAKVATVSVYPNPASDFLVVGDGGLAAKLTVVDVTGRIVQHSDTYSTGARVDVSALAPGQYYIVLDRGEERLVAHVILR